MHIFATAQSQKYICSINLTLSSATSITTYLLLVKMCHKSSDILCPTNKSLLKDRSHIHKYL